ncbi:MAG: hypothetical protein CME19_07835 [Gemmatimonadetes bacterium]|nr:hypothetical protein [Gemmatimonadota bacterium]
MPWRRSTKGHMTDDTTDNTSTSSRLQQAILVGLGMMLVLVPLYFSPSMSDYHTPKFILVQVFATILGCLLLISMVLDGEVYILDHPIYYTMLAFLAANFISLFQAANVYQGLYSLWIQLCFFILSILCFHCLKNRRQVMALAATMAAAGSLVGVIGLLQHNDIYHFYHRWNIAASTIGNVNFVAEYYNVVYPISLVLLLIVRNPWVWSLLLTGCFAMTCHLIVMGSRGGWLGVVIAASVIVGSELIRRHHVGRRTVDALMISVLTILLGWPILTSVASSLPVSKDKSLAALSETYWDVVVTRSTDALVLGDTSTRQRVYLWEDTFRLILDRPLLGIGTGNYEFHIQGHLGEGSLEIKSTMERDSGIDHMIFRAHNDYLEVWAETGILGMLAFVVLMVQVLRSVYGLLRRYVRGKEDPIVVGLCAAVLATMAHALFSSNFQNPASAVVFWVVVGFVWVYSVDTKDRPRLGLFNTSSDGFSFGLAAAGVAIVLFTVYHGYRMREGAILFQTARTQMTREEFEDAKSTLQTSLRYPSPRPFATYEMLGKVLHHFEQWREAEEALRRSLQHHPNHPSVHYFLARSLVQQGRADEAILLLARGIEMEPFRASYHIALGTALGHAGRHAEGVASLEHAIKLAPNNKDAYYALGGLEQQRENHAAALEAFEEALRLATRDPEIRNSRAKQLVLLQRYDEAIEEFRSIIREHRGMESARLNLAVALLQAGNTQGAIGVCAEMLRLWPGHQSARRFLQLIYKHMGETDNVRRVANGELQ